jgi:hypothetical protein
MLARAASFVHGEKSRLECQRPGQSEAINDPIGKFAGRGGPPTRRDRRRGRQGKWPVSKLSRTGSEERPSRSQAPPHSAAVPCLQCVSISRKELGIPLLC